MPPRLENTDHINQEQTALAENFIRFYEKNDHLFSHQDKDVAKSYFNAVGENLSGEKLLERQRQCISMCERAISFALNQRKAFFDLLRSLPIAFDRKDELRIAFINGDFQVKANLLEFLNQEERRITTKREAQQGVIEALKNQFIAFYANHANYFNEADRELAINYALGSINKFRTHVGRMARLQMLLTMLPSNLDYAQKLDEQYQSLLLKKIAEGESRDTLLAKFRDSNFVRKNELLKTLSELVVVEKKKDPEMAEKAELLEKYRVLYNQFPNDLEPKNFSVLTLAEQKKILLKKQESNAHEEAVLKATQKEKEKEQVTDNLSEAGKGEISPVSKQSAPANNICTIAIRIIQNHRGKKYNDDKEIIEDIESEMKQDNILGSFSQENLSAMRGILPRLPQQYWGTASAAAWIKKELQSVTIVQEYTS